MMQERDVKPLQGSDKINEAARQLEAGRLVAFPTETVYGLGADAENSQAIQQIYAVKGRPADHPVIVHLAPGAAIDYWAKNIPPAAYQLIAAFWPGPLTLILQRADHIPDTVSGGQDTIGLRCPSHPVAQALLSSFKGGQGGIAAPSANKFGHVSPTSAQHVLDEFAQEIQNGTIGLVLEGGQSEVGIESSILDLTRLVSHGPVLLRPGQISAQAIEQILGVPVQSASARADSSAPRASGTLDAHYAPNTPVITVSSELFESTKKQLLALKKRVATMFFSADHSTSNLQVAFDLQMPNEVSGYAHHLYAGLRQLDTVGAD
jgi:L-threonylcarbamoyladenylate synthase